MDVPTLVEKEHRVSKVDFSYLVSQLSPSPGAWSPPRKSSQPDLEEFIDMDNESTHSEKFEYKGETVHGILEHARTRSADSKHSSISLNNSILSIKNESHNTSSSFLNSSVPTNDILNNSSFNEPFVEQNQVEDHTPIVHQQQHFDDSTPVPARRQTIDSDDLKLSSEVITNIFAEDSMTMLEPESKNQSRIQSTTSSIYSALPNRIQSTTSSMYSEIPGHKSVDITDGLKKFRISSMKPQLHKHTSQPLENLEEVNEEVEFQDNVTSKYDSLVDDQPLDFTSPTPSAGQPTFPPNTVPRVSVLDQSIYKNKGEPAQSKTLSSVQSQQNIEKMMDKTGSSKTESFDNYEMTEESRRDETEDEDEDTSALFVTAIYAFNADSLESENDSSICLSFDQDEIAFTYNLDDSGWGEVTLLSSLKRGWVPMNYFKSTVTSGIQDIELKSLSPRDLAETRAPLKLLLKHAGTFLLNPQSKPVYINGELRGYTFDVECFNGMTDGVRKLLIDTNCISRSNSVVQSKPVVRKMRKKLLRGWADLIGKGKDYMGTIASSKIEYLQLLTFHLLQKAITFLDIWRLEQERLDEETQQLPQRVDKNRTTLAWDSFESVNLNILYLENPPILSYRINEIYNQLITYFCLIAGRIDLVEHNPKSFQVVATVTGHINLLINEYFFIIKLLKSTMNEQDSEKRLSMNLTKYGKLTSNMNLKTQMKKLDLQTEKLRQMVEELNTYIKILHDSAKKEMFNRGTNFNATEVNNNLYFYSREGGAVVVCACKMIELCSSIYYIMKNSISFDDSMLLPQSRRYPNYLKMSVTPEEFIKKCSSALANDSNIQKQVSKYKRESIALNSKPEKLRENVNRVSQQYSIFKMGNSTDVQLSSAGLDFLSHINSDEQSNFLADDLETDLQATELSDLEFNVESELIRSQTDGKIIGASFRALVYLLTDESNPPDYFFINAFFLTFRIFADSTQLLEALIRRFDVNDDYKNRLNDGTGKFTEIKVMNKRKLVAKSFRFWLESYWNSRNDYSLLAPLMNFFNEGMKNFLPIESYQLLVTASKLIGNPPIENNDDRLNFYNNFFNNEQLLPRKISSKLHQKTLKNMSLGANPNGLLTEIEAYNAFLDDVETYDLEKIDEAPIENNSRLSLSLNLNIELKNSGSNSVLLTPQQISMIRMIIMSYRRMLGTHWYKKHIENQFEPLDTKTLIDSWWSASQESWKILNDDLTLLNFNGLEIAKQLTLIESKLFCSIQVGELLNQNFTTKKLHLNLSPNIQKSILFTNLLSDYVIESILKPDLKMRQRIHAFKCWLKISISCLYLRNFNSLASIMTSLQSFLITRISAIWEGLTEKYKELFHYLASIIHPNKNYSAYRDRLRDFLSTNEQDNIDIPIVPYLSLFLQDLTFIVDGNPNYRTNSKSFLDEKLINIDKYLKITRIVSDIQALQISYKDVGELGQLYNDKNTDIIRSETIKNLKEQLGGTDNMISFADMFDIYGVPILQELILLEIWKVKQTNARDDDRSWKLSCAIQPRDLNG